MRNQLTISDFKSDHGRACVKFSNQIDRLEHMIRLINGFYTHIRTDCEEYLSNWYKADKIEQAKKLVNK